MSYQNHPTFWRGDVYFADLGKCSGSVQSGYRPVIVIQNNKGNHNGPTLVVVPVSSEIKKLHLPVHVLLSQNTSMKERSMAMCEQITTIDKSQIGPYVCHLEQCDLDKINRAILISLGISSRYYGCNNSGNDEMVITLCREHLRPYFYNPRYRVQRLNYLQTKERCMCCDKLGYDYRISTIKMK